MKHFFTARIRVILIAAVLLAVVLAVPVVCRIRKLIREEEENTVSL